MLKKHGQFWESIFLIADIIVIAFIWVISYYLRFSGILIPAYKGTPPIQEYLFLLLPILLIWPFLFKNLGLYRPRRMSSPISEIFDIIKASTLAVIILIAATFFIRQYEFSRLVFIYFWFLSVIALSLERWAFRGILRYFRRIGYNLRHVLIVGAGDLGCKVAKKIRENPWAGLEVVGYLDDYKQAGEMIEGKRIIGKISDLVEKIHEHDIDQVFIALPIRAYRRLMYAVERLKDEMVTIRIVPDIYQTTTLNANVEEFEGVPLINLTDTSIYGWGLVMKRFFDIAFSLFSIILMVPLMIIIALIIKFTSNGPVLFKQRRCGLDGRIIWVYKFRTMTVCEDLPTALHVQRDDLRLTKFGKFLRRTSLDELPQFINVLQGRMSVVGPRPHALMHNDHYRKVIKSYMLRHKVKPGITGWAQVNGWRGNTSLEKRIECDLFYIENWSLWLDIKIMWLTIWKGLVNKNAY